MKKWPSSAKYWMAVAAALALIAIVLLFPFSGADAPDGKIFAFIPGEGIFENNDTIQYVLSEVSSSAENADMALSLENVTATRDAIHITVVSTRKGITQEQGTEELESGKRSLRLRTILRADHLPVAGYEKRAGGGGGSLSARHRASFDLKQDEIKTGVTYHLEYPEYGLSHDFKLKNYETFERLEQVGPTATSNDISITAVSSQKDGVLTVDLYPVNKTRFRIEYLSSADNRLLGKGLRLETSSGARPYRTPAMSATPNRRFFFDLSPGDKDLVLSIPYLQVVSSESVSLKLAVPSPGHKVVVNQKVKFEDATMTIVDVEKTRGAGGEWILSMTLNYVNKRPNMIMRYAEFNRTSFLGFHEGGGYSAMFDANEVAMTTMHYDLENDEETLRLQLSNPVYYLIGGYSLRLDK